MIMQHKHFLQHKHFFGGTVLVFGLFLMLSLTSCHKTCTCTRYDGAEDHYSADELDAREMTCAAMIYQAGVQYYSICNWE